MLLIKIALASLAGLAALTGLVWAVANAIRVHRRSQYRCPSCHRSRFRESWPRPWDRFVAWAMPFRCEACKKRFYVRRSVVREWGSAATLSEWRAARPAARGGR